MRCGPTSSEHLIKIEQIIYMGMRLSIFEISWRFSEMETEIVLEEEEEEMPFDLAGAGSRLISYLIDWLIFVMISVTLVNVIILTSYDANVAMIVAFLYMFISVAYFTYFFGKGQTPGMMAMKIKLIGVDGTYPIGYNKGFLRLIGIIISSLPFNLGFIWILIDKRKQGWHDKIAGTYVVKE